jgi:hypothetical protein
VKCQLCDAGRHQGAPNQISCASCPAGQFGIGNRTGCVRCPARTFCANSGAHSVDYCVACGKGSETQKLSGEYISTGGAKCAKCQPGDYTANETNTSLFRCLHCKGGFVTDTLNESGATRCDACAVGKATPKSTHSCQPCSSAQRSNFMRTSCVACPRNQLQHKHDMGKCECIDGWQPLCYDPAAPFQSACVPSYACPAGMECRNVEQNITNGTENHSTVSKTSNTTKLCREKSDCSVCRPGTAGHEVPGALFASSVFKCSQSAIVLADIASFLSRWTMPEMQNPFGE